MPDANDMDLMREYADRNSETAFASVVHRHINLVYSVALRFTGNSPDAQDVTQAVFVILAQKAASLRQRTTLTGWLYETTRFTARQLLRTRARQQAREQEAYMQSTLNDSNTDGVWKQLAPLLEEAMTRLNEKERTLVALRFFENKSAAETAALLGIQEWAAHKRAARAMEKLRQFFVKRGIASTTATLAGAISANSVQAAPAMLAKTTTAVALAKGATASISTLTLIKGALKIMAWTKTKASIAIGVAAILAVSTTTLIIHHQHRIKASLTADVPRESWAFAGYATPEATVQSVFWAMREKSSSSFSFYLDGLVPEMRDKMEKEIQSRGDDAFAKFSEQEMGGVTRYRILKEVMLSGNKAKLQIQFGGLRGPVQTLTLEKIGNAWKFAGG